MNLRCRMHPALRCCFLIEIEIGIFVTSVDFHFLNCDYIVPDFFVPGYTCSSNTFQQAFNRKNADFCKVCASNKLFYPSILFIITKKSDFFCGKVFELHEHYKKIFFEPYNVLKLAILRSFKSFMQLLKTQYLKKV